MWFRSLVEKWYCEVIGGRPRRPDRVQRQEAKPRGGTMSAVAAVDFFPMEQCRLEVGPSVERYRTLRTLRI